MFIEFSNSVNIADDSGTVLSDGDLLLKDSKALEVPLSKFLVFTLFLTSEKKLLSVALTAVWVVLCGTLLSIFIEIISSSSTLIRLVNVRVSRRYLRLKL